MRFTAEEIAAATGGMPLDGPFVTVPMRISTDTRAVEPGDAFLALSGEHFDGHEFVGAAFARGAVVAIVARAGSVPGGRPAFVVDDTRRAYMALAGAARKRIGAHCIAVTGSTGKTTTKGLLAQLLAASGLRIAATPQNENNEIGVSKLLLGLEGEEEAVVIEMGARHYGEIAELAAIARPDAGILTNIGEAHLEIMGTPERLAETKWGLFSTGASAILNLADTESRRRSSSLGDRPVEWYGVGAAASNAFFPATLIPQRNTLVSIDRDGKQVSHQVEMRLPGEHNLENLAAAVAAARGAGAATAALLEAIPGLVLPPGRYERVSLGNGAVVVYDAYNASLSGTLATLRAFAEEPASRRIAVLGGMAELGPQTPKMHKAIGAAAHANRIDLVLAGGTEAASIVRGARKAGMRADAVIEYSENNTAIAWLRANLVAGDAVLLKGSRMYKMEEILSALRGGIPVLH